MSEYYDEMAGDIALAERAWADREARRNFRTEVWTTLDGRRIPITDMEDSHLLNAYRLSQYQPLFREMVLRLFETRIKENTK
jgi:hypothetical protein